MITASLKNYRISPRKFRLLADMIRGKSVAETMSILSAATKGAKHPLTDLVNSAVANAKNNFKIESDKLMIREILVNKGLTLKRFMPVSRGSAHPVKHRTSNVNIVLAPIGDKFSKNPSRRQTVKSSVKAKIQEPRLRHGGQTRTKRSDKSKNPNS